MILRHNNKIFSFWLWFVLVSSRYTNVPGSSDVDHYINHNVTRFFSSTCDGNLNRHTSGFGGHSGFPSVRSRTQSGDVPLDKYEVLNTLEKINTKLIMISTWTEYITVNFVMNWLFKGAIIAKGSEAGQRGRLQSWVKSVLHVIHTGSGAHPGFYPMFNGGTFPGGRTAGEWSWPLTSN